MKVYPSVVGRGAGNVGYNFSASTGKSPYSASWIGALRASDTTPDHQPILEMHCAGYGQPVIIASRWVVDNCLFGFSEYLEIELPEDAGERNFYLDHPGRALALDAMDGKQFLELSGKADTRHSLLPVMDVSLPPAQPGRSFHVPEDMLAALVADVWSYSFLRLTEARGAHASSAQKSKQSPIRLELTAENNASDTVTLGCAFINQELLPRLPASVRHIVSVSIGSHWSSLQSLTYMPVLAITLPDGKEWHMKGGYHLLSGEYESAGPEQYQEFGSALIAGQHMEYYQLLSLRWAYTPLAANFLVAYYLFLIHKTLYADSLQPSDLAKATQLFHALDRAIRQYHETLSDSQRRASVLQVEQDLIQKRTTLCSRIVDDVKTYDMFIRKAFAIDHDLREILEMPQLQALKDAYANLLCAPEKLSDMNQLPVTLLWIEPELSDLCRQSDPGLLVQCVRQAFQLHLPVLAGAPVYLEKLLRLRAALLTPHQQALDDVLADAMARLLESAEWPRYIVNIRQAVSGQGSAAQRIDTAVVQYASAFFPDPTGKSDLRNQVKEYCFKLEDAQQQAFSSRLCNAYCDYYMHEQVGSGRVLDPLIDTCKLFGWLAAEPVKQTVFTALQYRAQAAARRVSQAEKDTLLAYAKTADSRLTAEIERALTPLANAAADPDLVAFLADLLPLIHPNPIVQPLTGAWHTAYQTLLRQALASLLEDARSQVQVLLSPQDCWGKHCAFPWLSLQSLDDLTQHHLNGARLEADTEPALTDILTRCSLTDLIRGIHPAQVGSGWFSVLLKRIMAQLLDEKKLAFFIIQCNGYTQMSGLMSLCDCFLEEDMHTEIRDALRFAARRTGADSKSLIAVFRQLKDPQTAGRLLGALLQSDDTGPWNLGRWEDRIVLAYLSNASAGINDRTMLQFLQDIGIDLPALGGVMPLRAGDGAAAFQTVLYVFRWLHQMQLTSAESALVQALQNAGSFTRSVQKNKQLRRIFAPATDAGFPPQDKPFSSMLLTWLFRS